MTNNLKAERTLTAELLPCPFCGSHAEAAVIAGDAYVECLGCSAEISMGASEDYQADIRGITERWNTRQSLSTQQPMGEVTDEMVHRASVAMNIGFRDFHVPERAIKRALLSALHPNQESGE